MNKTTKKLIKVLLPLLIAGAALTLGPGHARAAFDPGRIIDDSLFTNGSSMSEANIQDWLVSKNSTCLKNATSAEPFYDTSQPNNVRYGADVPVSRVIWKTAQQFGINAQVILVTLQKEQGLITRTSCPASTTSWAMGMGCPDSSPGCDSRYEGFSRQVWEGTKLLRNCFYQDVGWYCGYIPFATNRVYFNPNAGCGYSDVYISNRATATLYNYTPYQPNAAALATRYGTGDSCSAYGNRNFHNFYEDWFGPPVGENWTWFVDSQSGPNVAVRSGQRAVVTLRARNSGTTTWTNGGANPVKLGTVGPRDRASQFWTDGWSGNPGLPNSRPATLREGAVGPGQIGTFSFEIQAPYVSSPTTYTEAFSLVAENKIWLNDPGFQLSITVSPPGSNTASVSSISYNPNIESDQPGLVTVKMVNTGDDAWYRGGQFPVKIGTAQPHDHSGTFYDGGSSWFANNRAAYIEPNYVLPGQTATFSFYAKMPHTTGPVSETYDLLAENLIWFGDEFTLTFNVQPSYTATLVSPANITMVPGEPTTASVQLQNTGTATWVKTGANPVKLGTRSPFDHTSPMCFAPPWPTAWPSCTRAALSTAASVAPGATGTFQFDLNTPYTASGTYHEDFQLVAENLKWFGDIAPLTVNYTPPNRTWSQTSVGSWTDSSKTTTVDLTNLTPGQSVYVEVKATNSGNATWYNNGPYPVRLGTQNPQDRISRYGSSWNIPNLRGTMGTRAATVQEASVAPGGTGTFAFTLTVPGGTGTFDEYFNLVAEGLAWFDGSPPLIFHTVVH